MSDALATLRGSPRWLVRLMVLGIMFGPAGWARARAQDAAPDPGALVQPALQNSAEIVYPEALRRLAPPPQGRVLIKLVVGVDGVPRELELVERVHPELDALALTAAGALRYSPGLYKGRPIEVVLSVAIDIAAPAGLPPLPAPVEPEPPVVVTETGGPGADAEPVPAGPVRMQGLLLEAGLRLPVSGASVLVVPAAADAELGEVRKKDYGEAPAPAWQQRVFTAEDGSFTVRGLPDGKVRVIVLAQGFERLEYVEQIEKNGRLEVKYYQRRMVVNPYRTVVASRRNEPEEVSRRTISVQEINNLPGTQGDALKAIQNFPGVARPPFGAGLLVIRGAAPADSRTYLGHHEIPQLFHFGALSSTFNSDILAQIDFIPGNFDSRFGDAIGGIINVNPRKGRRDGIHGYIDADVFDAGVLLEGKVGKGSFALSGRRSYIDAVLKATVPADSGLGLTQAPRYYDYQALFDYPVGGGELSIRWFGSDDRFKLIATPPNDTADTGSNSAQTAILFHRFDVIYRKQTGPWEFLITPSFNFQRLSGKFGNLFEFDFPNTGFSFRTEATRQISERFALRVGAELQAGRYKIDARAPGFPAAAGLGGTGVFNVGDSAQSYAIPALYATGTIQLGDRFTLLPGVRLASYTLMVKKATVDPRLRFMAQVAEQTTIKGGVGLYSQIPDLISLNPIWGNPRASVERSVHTSLGVQQTFESVGVSLEVTGFYKYVFDRSTQSTRIIRAPDDTLRLENFANQGVGQIFGGELLLRKALTKKFFGWVSYTLMRSLVQEKPGEAYKPFAFDQPHILTVIAVYKLPRGWQVGGRFRLVSGNPTTLYKDGVYNNEDGGYLNARGTEGRLPAFHQLDLRVDKTFTYKRLLVNVYLDVINVYNHQNPEAIVYSYNLQQNTVQAGLPIIPSLGTRLEF
jgi:hypothetical protein